MTKSNWPKTSYNEFSKRMFICFMIGFFVHVLITVAGEAWFEMGGSGITILQICIPVYTTIFAAVIVKGGVENVFKGKSLTSSTSSDSDDNG